MKTGKKAKIAVAQPRPRRPELLKPHKELVNELRESKAARKKDALALAHLLYDMYKEERRGKMENGQNNAQDSYR